jgi:hypothetical protein
MGISLNGLTPAGTYPGLIKTGDNTAINGTPKVLSDGNGNDLPMEVSTTGVNFTNNLTQGGTALQPVLVSGTNIKTINGASLLGSGNIPVVTSPSGVSGAIQFSDGSAFASDATNFFWDNTNKRLGVGTNTPTRQLDVVGTIAASSSVVVGGLTLQSNFLWGQGSGIRFRVDTPSQGGVAVNTSPISNVTTVIRGWGSTSATTSLLVQNSAGVASLQVLDDTSVFNYGKGAITTNTAFGNGALINNTTGIDNTAIGREALRNNTTGGSNTANGLSALQNNTTGGNNTANGAFALFNNTSGSGNTANGFQALLSNATGVSNTAIGQFTLRSNATGGSNTAIGREALRNNTASNNVAVGFEAALTNTSATGVTAIGYQALRASTGNDNTALGFQAGDNITTGAGNVCIGSGAEPLAATDSNQFVVGTATINAGSVVTESNSSTKVWNVIINGVAQKILLA